MHEDIGARHVGFKGGPPKVAMHAMLERERMGLGCKWVGHSSSFFWHEDLVFVAGEALEGHLILLVENHTT